MLDQRTRLSYAHLTSAELVALCVLACQLYASFQTDPPFDSLHTPDPYDPAALFTPSNSAHPLSAEPRFGHQHYPPHSFPSDPSVGLVPPGVGPPSGPYPDLASSFGNFGLSGSAQSYARHPSDYSRPGNYPYDAPTLDTARGPVERSLGSHPTQPAHADVPAVRHAVGDDQGRGLGRRRAHHATEDEQSRRTGSYRVAQQMGLMGVREETEDGGMADGRPTTRRLP